MVETRSDFWLGSEIFSCIGYRYNLSSGVDFTTFSERIDRQRVVSRVYVYAHCAWKECDELSWEIP